MKWSLGMAGLVAAVWLCALPCAQAQGRGAGGGRPGGMQGAGFHAPGGTAAANPASNRGPGNVTRNEGAPLRTTQLGPKGRWWDNAGVARSVGLSRDQQRKMDGIFNANKSALLESYQALQREQTRLDAVSKEALPDRAKLFAQIDAVNQARASLEKVNTQMLLEIRQSLDAEQLGRLGKLSESPSN